MANTTNLNLGKLGGSEKLKTYPTTQAGNMDIIDSAFGAGFGVSGAPSVNTSINNLADGLAIVANGNTHAAITSGQFVYVRNHGSLSEGLYIATSNISANGTLSGSNLTADTAGGLNALNDKFRVIASGSMHDIKTTGLYYLTSAVSDKPVETGGYYSVSVYGPNLLNGIYTVFTGGRTFVVSYHDNNWEYNELAINSKVVNATGGNTVRLYSFNNVNSISITVPFTINTNNFINGIVINANQDYLSSFDSSADGHIRNKGAGSIVSTSVSGSTITITPSGSLWGNTLVILSSNNSLY